FGFTKREYNALLGLFGLLMLAIVTPYGYERFFVKEEIMSDFETKAIQDLGLIAKNEYNRSDFRRKENEVPVRSSLFNFDPNLIGIGEWKKLGLSTKQAQSILNYRNKGGKFYKIDDLKKMYAISAKMFERLQPYVEIAGMQPSSNRKNFEVKIYPKKESIQIEINMADTTKLDEIKGIGAAFARRIAKYRDRLGGFHQKEQLMEVFGLDSIKFEEIKSQILIDVSAIKKININTADFETLKNHPYLKYKQINAIIQYRKQHGNYGGIADLKKLLILSPQTIEQLTPYLEF
ncbi:MAG: helix-hairpin-helix domain-containing protein, partial [Pedobacter sp.]|nr:helix-hairpin-helix domain-containing protein [Pedobacter sp.]